jgi:hypothetical protein
MAAALAARHPHVECAAAHTIEPLSVQGGRPTRILGVVGCPPGLERKCRSTPLPIRVSGPQ